MTVADMPRMSVKKLCDLPNVGKAIEKDFHALGIRLPQTLVGKDPYQLYQRLCRITQAQHDPCMIDVFMAAIRYMEGVPPQKWWAYTAERKQHLATMGCQ